MAAPSFSTPQRATPAKVARRFTLEQANSALPLVKRIVADIVKTHGLASGFRQTLERTSATKETAIVQKQLDGAIDRLEQLVDELCDVGVELKDYETGLVDFVGKHEGRDVYLCWKLGEEKITHWHELNTGFAGRKPVSTLREREKA
jgi:hypothetical protein